jgi:tetratricopeptide (TPR) repeat protein
MIVSLCAVAPAVILADDAPPADRAALNAAYDLMARGQGAEAIPIFDAYLRERPNDVTARIDFAYLLDKQGDQARAIEQMELARQSSPLDAALAKQLGYWYLQAGRPQDALAEFDAVLLLTPEDQEARVQRAYILDERGDHYAAARDFALAADGEDAEIAAEARETLRSLLLFGNRPQPAPWWGELYAEHRIARRFDTQTGNAVLREGISLGRDSCVDLYLTARSGWLRQDSADALPITLTDNSTLVGLGLRAQPRSMPGLTAFVEVSSVVQEPTFVVNDESTDFRAGLYYFGNYGVERQADGYVRGPVSELYGEAIYYNRFGNNWIGTLRYRYGYRIAASRRSAVDAYLSGQVMADTQGDFFNNVAEPGIGLRWMPPLPGNWQLTLEYVQGYYTGNDSRTPNPFDSSYDDLRGTIAVFTYF